MGGFRQEAVTSGEPSAQGGRWVGGGMQMGLGAVGPGEEGDPSDTGRR